MTLSLFASERPWATFSEDGGGKDGLGTYRYVLAWPTGVSDDRYALFVLANPSTATAEETDPTVKRCIGYARRWGFGWARVVNVRAWRETNPKLVPADPLAIGPDNDRHIVEQADGAALVVCGWGNLGGARGAAVLQLLERHRPCALALNADGSPVHPLYQPLDAELVRVPFGGTK